MNISQKLEYWKSRLLDLGKRNRLINCPVPSSSGRITRTSLLMSAPNAESLWELLNNSGGSFEFPLPPIEISVTDGKTIPTEWENVKTNQTPNETYKTLRSLMKKDKEFTEEKGLNALFLAFGFLNWKENGKESLEIRSPLLLLPVGLKQEDLFSPFILSREDDEITTNHSLNQKLLGDFGIELPALNVDTSLNSYLQDVENVVANLGWSVSADVAQLAIFSFTKINMYRDLERNADKILSHHIVRTLNGETFKDAVTVTDITDYDHDTVEPQFVFSVIDADSSQQDAILLAKRGASFVLQGPPGTGKSQTITNIIAELIADGKKVLFVSEKMAALEVVYKRLCIAGLGDFCLMLHSNNARRREILDQFEKSIKLSRSKTNIQQEAFNKLYKLKEIRTMLNAYSKELHTVTEPLGKTIYQVNGCLAQLESFRNIDYVQSDVENFTQELLSQCESALEELERIIKASGYQQENPWKGCVLTQWTHEFKQQFIVDTTRLIEHLESGIELFNTVNGVLEFRKEWAFDGVNVVTEFLGVCKNSPNVPFMWASLDLSEVVSDLSKWNSGIALQREIIDLNEVLTALMSEVETGKRAYDEKYNKWQTAYAELLAENDENILQIDAEVMLGLYRSEYRTWLRGFISGYRKAQKQLLAYRRTANKFSYAGGLTLLDKIVAIKALNAECIKQAEILKTSENSLSEKKQKVKTAENSLLELHFDDICESLNLQLGTTVTLSNYSELLSKVNWLISFINAAKENRVGSEFIKAVCECDDAVIQRLSEIVSRLLTWRTEVTPDFDKFASLFGEKNKNVFYNAKITEIIKKAQNCCNHFAFLQHLIDYRNAEKRLISLGIDEYLKKARELNLTAEEIIEVFRKCFYRSWLDAIVPKYPAVNEFRRLRQDERVEVFKTLDKSHFEISKAMLLSKLISHLPNFDAFSGSGEIALVRREMAKHRKLMPTRLLIANLPNLLPAVKPCVMMSPLSVSTYLGDSNFEFDTVIFDEASQVQTEDAIGAIFRAKQAIIAGDSKQLPPTNFFGTSMSNSDEFEEDEDGEIVDTGAYESLLDEAAMLPSQTLLWHYRSRHEHLIAFSNQKIYGGNLTTFPSSVDKTNGMGVEYIYVAGGVYDRGGKNGNKAEAARVAKLVFEHFCKEPNRSLGIIAFGEVQQSAIQDALDEKRRANPTFEHFFKDGEEALFIKNLETVQGDERDTIIFSIGYAPDTAGKFTMNFGPLTKSGGERRLNVAITRARYNLKLVGSILPTDIDISRTNSQGTKLLRLYIDFAINGINAILSETSGGESLWFDSPFESSVYDFLTANGFDVATQVGCSGYRIDMAVKHPKYSGRYAIGIECDGAMYHSARTARERDRLRQTVLEDMGWNIYRIWSTDWIKDKHTEGERLIQAVRTAIENYCETAPQPHNISSDNTSQFLEVNTQSEYQSKWEGESQKRDAIRSRFFGYRSDEIPNKDYAETMLKVLENDFGLDKAGLFKDTALYGYGWERQGSTIKAKFETAFTKLLREGKIVEENGKIKISELCLA